MEKSRESLERGICERNGSVCLHVLQLKNHCTLILKLMATTLITLEFTYDIPIIGYIATVVTTSLKQIG